MVRVKKAKKVVVKKTRSTNNRIRIIKAKTGLRTETGKVSLGVQELSVGTTKFSNPEIQRLPKTFSRELPSGYGVDKMALLVRDPWWLYTYWEIKQETVERLKSELKDEFYIAKRVLRVYDVTNIIFNGSNANHFFDIQIHEFANNWYIDAGSPGKSWCVDLGLKLSDGRFITILRSNVVQTPLDGPSEITDEEWMIPDDMFARLYGMGFGLGRSSPVGKAWRERMISSPGIASMASPVKKAQKRGFWLRVDCELIVYGATVPDAKVTVQGKAINLRPDGTFTLRFALPDGKQVIPVKAVSADKVEERVITPIVTRETK
ncbi:MAG: DUF4912 domain-containing protein [Candidatus Omnitrophota bacterium]|nr:DUF4912 domain-containing protein [Candidatus Omnitrophota bacterium]